MILILVSADVSESVLNYAMTFSFWLLIIQPMVAIMWCDNSYFNGSGHAVYSFISGTIRLWVIRIPLIYLLEYIFPILSYNSISVAMVISNIIILILNVFLKRKITLERTVTFDEEFVGS